MNEKIYLDYDGLERYHDLLLRQLETKADKVSNSTSGNFAFLTNDGNIADSGHAHSDYVLKTDLEEIEEVVSASLNDLNTRKADLSELSNLSDLYLPLSGGKLTGTLLFDNNDGYGGISIDDNRLLKISSGEGVIFDNDIISSSNIRLNNGGYINANKFTVNGGTSSQFLKADGSVDSNTYLTSSSLSDYVTSTSLNTTLANYIKGSTSVQEYTINTVMDLSSAVSLLSEGESETHIMRNTGSSKINVKITASSTVITPTGSDISFDIPAGGYGEYNCVKVGNVIYVRGV